MARVTFSKVQKNAWLGKHFNVYMDGDNRGWVDYHEIKRTWQAIVDCDAVKIREFKNVNEAKRYIRQVVAEHGSATRGEGLRAAVYNR